MSVADMEFKPAPEIVEALVQSATHDVYAALAAPARRTAGSTDRHSAGLMPC